MARGINVCLSWRTKHDRPVYTLEATCPTCGGPAGRSTPAPFNPNDPYGEYRRALKRRTT